MGIFLLYYSIKFQDPLKFHFKLFSIYSNSEAKDLTTAALVKKITKTSLAGLAVIAGKKTYTKNQRTADAVLQEIEDKKLEALNQQFSWGLSSNKQIWLASLWDLFSARITDSPDANVKKSIKLLFMF